MEKMKSRREIILFIGAFSLASMFGGLGTAAAQTHSGGGHGKGAGKSGGGHSDSSHEDEHDSDHEEHDSDHEEGESSGRRGPHYHGGKEMTTVARGHGRSLEDRVLRSDSDTLLY